jgi:hypothetical protein
MFPITQLNSTQDYVNFLKGLKARAAHTVAAQASAVQANLDTMIANVQAEDHEETAKQWADKVKAAGLGDVTAKAEVSRIRLLRTQNFLVAMSNWMPFFREVSLAENEIPYWQNESQMETTANYTGADGRPRKSTIVKHREQVQINLHKVTSDEVEYLLIDPYKGRIADETKALINIARDMAVKIDQYAKPFVQGATVANFSNGSSRRSGKTFVLHSVVAAANLPAGNQIQATADSRFSKAAMDAIIKYCASFGNLYGEMLRPVAIYLPASDSTGHLADVTLTSNSNSIVEQIFGGGIIQNYGGFNWPLIPDITLSPADKFAYVRFNMPVGEYYTKPSLDEMFDEVTRDSRINNKGMMYQSKWIGFCTPLPWNPFVLRVQYKP